MAEETTPNGLEVTRGCRRYRAIRPDDGLEVPVTCTPEHVKDWQKQGYKFLGPGFESEGGGEPVSKRK